MTARRRAFTLVELMITVAIIGIVSTVAVLAFRVPVESSSDDLVGKVFAARRQALKDGRPVTVDIVTAEGVRTATAYPSGTIVADAIIGIERLDIVEPKRRQ